jgi:hypothetical protein
MSKVPEVKNILERGRYPAELHHILLSPSVPLCLNVAMRQGSDCHVLKFWPHRVSDELVRRSWIMVHFKFQAVLPFITMLRLCCMIHRYMRG